MKSKRFMLVAAGLMLSIAAVVWGVSLLSRGDDVENPPPGPASPDETPVLTVQQKKIQAAIDKGVDFLKTQLLENDIPAQDTRFGEEGKLGAMALAGLALLEAGVPAHDPAVRKVLQRVRQRGPTVTVIYPLGSILFFLNRLAEDGALTAADRQLLRTLALRLIGGQSADGRWNYNNFALTPAAEQELMASLKNNTYKPTKPGSGSHSMTQFAILALWGARKQDIPVRGPLLAAARGFHGTQKPNGTWNYHLSAILHDSNTCAGLLALAVEKILREDREFRSEGSSDPPANPKASDLRDKAFAHLATVVGRTKESPAPYQDGYTGGLFKADAWGDYYFLWCLERVSVIYGLSHIGGKDWYKWGSEVVLKNQRPSGGWLDKHGEVADTSFALLFLTKANLAKDLTDKLRELMEQSRVEAPLGPLERVPFGWM